MVRRALLAASVLTLVVVSDAHACSCAYTKPRAALSGAKHAFVGRVKAVHRHKARATFTFHVRRELKGNFRRRVRVRTASQSSACGLELKVGDRAGLIVDRRRGHWVGGLCSQYGARELARAGRGMKPHQRRRHHKRAHPACNHGSGHPARRPIVRSLLPLGLLRLLAATRGPRFPRVELTRESTSF